MSNIQTLQVSKSPIFDFDMHQNMDMIFNVNEENSINQIHSLTLEQKVHKIQDQSNLITCLAICKQDPKIIALGGKDKQISLFQSPNFETPIQTYQIYNEISCLEFSSDQNLLGIGTSEGTIHLIDLLQKTIHNCQDGHGHGQKILSLSFDSRCVYLSSVCNEAKLNIYSIKKIVQQSQDGVVHIMQSKIICQNSNIMLRENFALRAMWHRQAPILAIPGTKVAQTMGYEEEEFEFIDEPIYCHETEILIMYWTFQNMLVTASSDGQIKVWDFEKQQFLSQMKFDDGFQRIVQKIKHVPMTNVFVLSTDNGVITFWRNFEQPLFIIQEKKLPENGIIEQQIEASSETALTLKNSIQNGQKKKVFIDDDQDDDYIEERSNNQKNIAQENQDQQNANEKNGQDLMDIEENQNINDNNDQAILAPQQRQISSDLQYQQQQQLQPQPQPQPQQQNNTLSTASLLQIQQMVQESVQKQALALNQKQKDQINLLNDIFSAQPQQMVYPSSTMSWYKGRRFLCWNLVGSVSLRKEHDNLIFIDFEFADRTFHKNVVLPDQFGVTMAVLNQKGALLASQCEQENEDEYENEMKQTNKSSTLQFKGFSYQMEANISWSIQMQENESIECIAISTEFCVAATTLQFLRVYNLCGDQLQCICMDKPIVCLAAYENLIAYVYHDTAPIFGCQGLRMKLIDMHSLDSSHFQNKQGCFEATVPITAYSKLAWVGFSQEGLFLTQDTVGIVRGLNVNSLTWVPLLDESQPQSQPPPHQSNKKGPFFIIGMSEFEFVGVQLQKDELEPTVQPRTQTSIRQISISSTAKDEGIRGIEKDRFVLDHERYRRQMWGDLKQAREKSDPMYYLVGSILEPADIVELENKVEFKVLLIFNKHVNAGENEKALIVAKSMLKKAQSFGILTDHCLKLKLDSLYRKMNNIFKEKTIREQFLQQQQQQNLFPNTFLSMQNTFPQQYQTATTMPQRHQQQHQQPQTQINNQQNAIKIEEDEQIQSGFGLKLELLSTATQQQQLNQKVSDGIAAETLQKYSPKPQQQNDMSINLKNENNHPQKRNEKVVNNVNTVVNHFAFRTNNTQQNATDGVAVNTLQKSNLFDSLAVKNQQHQGTFQYAGDKKPKLQENKFQK